MPLVITENGVLTRSVRDTAAFYREMEKVWRNPKLPTIGDITQPNKQRLHIAFCTNSIRRDASPEVCDLTLKTAALLEELGHRVTPVDNPVPDRFLDDFLLYMSFLAFALVRGGRRMFGPSFDRSRLDNLTLGLDRNAARNLHRVPAAIGRLARSRRITAQMANTYDAILLPTLADVTPPVGHLDPMGDYDQVIDRLIDWVGFTPIHNATGDPAISLPLAQAASGMPVGMMLSATPGHEARLLELAYELEEARPWPRINSELTNDATQSSTLPNT